MSGSFSDEELGSLLDASRRAGWKRRRAPDTRRGRQPLHTVYVAADRFSADTVSAFGVEALRLLDAHAPDASSFAAAFGIGPAVASRTRERVLAKLEREPIEDLRVDFEDGYGARSDEEEDRDAVAAAEAVIAARAAGTFAPSYGVRVKSFADLMEARGVRTLDHVLATLVGPDGIPEGFVVTFPKVVAVEHVALFVEVLARLDERFGLADGQVRLEVQVETPESIVAPGGLHAIPGIVAAAGERLIGLHFGVFDYTSSLGLMPWEQRLDHPANDFARQIVQVAVAGTGVRLSDGSTNVVPTNDRTQDVHAAWRVHADHVRHSLSAGFYQGWDLHPAHLVSRYAAVYGWLLPHLDDATARVRAWRERARPAGVLDEPATIASLLRYLRFAVSSGAVDETDVLEAAALERDALHGDGVGTGQ